MYYSNIDYNTIDEKLELAEKKTGECILPYCEKAYGFQL